MASAKAETPPVDPVAALRRAFLFARLEDDDIQRVAAIAHFKAYPRDARVFERGDEASELLIVVEGRLKVVLLSEDGRELTLTIVAPHQTLGEMSLLDEAPRSASAVALGDVRVISIHKQDFRRLLESNPRIALALLAALSRRLRELSDDTAGLIFLDVHQRLARKLLTLASAFGEKLARGTHIPQRLTHQELANLVGATRETVTKALNELQATGVIDIEKKQVIILDQAALEACALHRV